MLIARKVHSLMVTFGAAPLLLTPEPLMVFRPFQAPEPGSGAKTDSAAANRASGCNTPTLIPRTPKASEATRSCGWLDGPSHGLLIGMTEEQPFTAIESVTMWRALPSNKKERREIKKKLIGWKASHDGTKLTSTLSPISLDRDSSGRVLLAKWPSEDFQHDITYWDKTLCDPQTASMTQFARPDTNWIPDDSQPRVHNQMFVEPSVQSLPWSTQVYGSARWSSADNRWKVLDLGYREIDGTRAHGHRWWSDNCSQCGDGDIKELWISEDLKIDLLYIEESPTKGRGMRAELAHLRLREPDRELFQMAKEVQPTLRNPKEPCAVPPVDHQPK